MKSAVVPYSRIAGRCSSGQEGHCLSAFRWVSGCYHCWRILGKRTELLGGKGRDLLFYRIAVGEETLPKSACMSKEAVEGRKLHTLRVLNAMKAEAEETINKINKAMKEMRDEA